MLRFPLLLRSFLTSKLLLLRARYLGILTSQAELLQALDSIRTAMVVSLHVSSFHDFIKWAGMHGVVRYKIGCLDFICFAFYSTTIHGSSDGRMGGGVNR